MKKLILFLAMSLLSTSLLAGVVQNNIEPSDGESPYQTLNGEACSQPNETPTSAKPCCNGLEIGNNGRCVEKPIIDPGLVTCTNDSQCQNGTACRPFSQNNLFSSVSPSFDNPEYDREKEAVEILLAEGEELKGIGQSCSQASECSSYSCSPFGKCLEKKVCRYADMNESPVAPQRCGEGLVLQNGICKRNPASEHPAYNSLLTEINFSQGAGQCSVFTVTDATKKATDEAIKHMRALEWMFMTHTVDPYNDCFDFTAAIKNDIIKKFYDVRKVATEVFAKKMIEVEKDILTLKTAKDAGDTIVTIHGTDSLTGKELALRMTSGHDAFKIMQARNNVFIEYQQTIALALVDTTAQLQSMTDKVGIWRDRDGQWDLGVRQTGNKDCSAKYRAFGWDGWKTKRYGTTESRWGLAYSIGTHHGAESLGGFDLNKTKPALVAAQNGVLFKDQIAKPLSAILNFASVEDFKAEYSKPFYLIDPVMHGGIEFKSYGKNYNRGSGGTLGFGRQDKRPLRYSPELVNIYNGRKNSLKDYYKEFRNNSSVTKGIYYEPEITPTEAKDCLAASAQAPTPELEAKRVAACSEFDKYLDEVLDISMAQFLAYSIRDKLNYRGYFLPSGSARMQLLSYTIVQSTNLGSYYTASVEMLHKQNDCLDKVIRGLHDDGIITSGEGIEEGSYYDPSLVPGDIGYGNGGPKNIRPGRGTISAANISSGLSSSLNSGSQVNVSGSKAGPKNNNTFGKGASDSAAGSFFATKRKDLIAKNKIAQSKGIKISNTAKDFADTVDSMNKNSSGASQGSSSSSGSSNENSKSSETERVITTQSKGEMDISGGSLPGGDGGFGGGSFSNSAQSSSSDGSDNVSQLTDQTGMSDEEKGRMLTIYDRNKNKYASDGDDGIFEKVSKAYVRNLEKILIRKKIVD